MNTGTVTLLPQWDHEYTQSNTKHIQHILAVYREMFFSHERKGLFKSFFPQEGEEDLHGSEHHYASVKEEGKGENKVYRQPFLFMGHLCLPSQLSTLVRSLGSPHILDEKRKHKTQEFFRSLKLLHFPQFPFTTQESFWYNPRVFCRVFHDATVILHSCPQNFKSLCLTTHEDESFLS